MPPAAAHIGPRIGLPRLDLAELWTYRDLLLMLAIRDLKLRYRQTALGVMWVVLGPLLSAGIFTFVFSRVAKLHSEGVSYFLFAFSGTIAFGVFNNIITRVSGSLTNNTQLVAKVYFHRLVLPLSTAFSTMVDFGVGAVLLAAAMALGGVAPGAALLTLPFWLLLLATIGLAGGLVAGAATVRYRDIGLITQLLVQLLMYISPVAYSASAVPSSAKFFYEINPMVGALNGFRWALFGTRALEAGPVAYSIAVAVIGLPVSLYMFRRIERNFADVI
jgi:lipopolysaccharide transport system permease protein